MKNFDTWKKRCVCWAMILCILFCMPLSSVGEGEHVSDDTTEVVAVVEEPTAVPATPEPTASPTPEPTAALTAEPTAAPTPEPTAAPTAEPTKAPAKEPAVTETPEKGAPSEVPTEEPAPTPEVHVAYVGYAQLIKSAKVYLGERDGKEEYFLPRGTIVYVDNVVLQEVERAFVSYSVDGKKIGGYVEVSALEGMSQEDQGKFKDEMKKAAAPIYYDNEKEIPLQEATPVYSEAPIATDVPVSTNVSSNMDEETLEEVFLPVQDEDGLQKKLEQRNARTIVTEAWGSATPRATYYCTTASQMQSSHPYQNNLTSLYIYEKTNAAYIAVTFSSNTEVENGYDAIGIFDAQGNLIGAYTGKELAGKTVRVAGNKVQIMLVTDVSVTKYGFRVTKLDTYTKPASLPTVTPLSNTSIRLTWKLPAGIAGYDVYHSASSNGTYTYLGTSTTANYTAVVPSAQVSYFKIRAFNMINGTKYSTSSSAFRSAFPLTRPTITGVTKVNATQLKVEWSTILNTTKYQIYHSTKSGGPYKLIAETALTSKTFTLDKTKAHFFKVRSVNTTAGSTSYFSQYSPVKAGVFSATKVTLNAPTTLDKDSVKLTWKAIVGVTGYQIYRSTQSGSGYVKIDETSNTNYTDTNCPEGKMVYYKVRAFLGTAPTREFGAFSAFRSTFALGRTTISTTRTGSNNQITWSKVSYASGYYVYRSTTEGGTYTQIAKVSSSTLTYTDKNAASGVYYKVQAYRANSGKTYPGPLSVANKAGPKYRALLVGNTYKGTTSELKAPGNDSQGMATMLGRMTKTPYSITRKNNQSASSIISEITSGSAFRGAQNDDVSLFYYSGHGSNGGVLVGNDLYGVSPSTLRSALDTVPGRKIVIIDACHSGGMIGKSQTDSFVNSFIAEFTRADRSLAAANYYVITAAHSSELSWEGKVNGKNVGIFTYALCKGAGWDYSKNVNSSFPADSNKDGTLTLREVYSYANKQQQQILAQSGIAISAQIYPTNSGFTMFSYK